MATKITERNTTTDRVALIMTDDDLFSAYVAGVIESSDGITIATKKSRNTAIGYTIEIQMRFSKRNGGVVRAVSEWCEEREIETDITVEENTTRFRIGVRDDLERFLKLLYPYLIIYKDAAEIVIDDIIPMMNNREHQTKHGFYKAVGYAEQVRELTNKPDLKYDQEYFEELWGDDLTDTA